MKGKFFSFLLISVVIVSCFGLLGVSSGYDSELNGYSYYKIVSYEAGVGAGTNYQVVIVCHYGTGTDGTMVLNGETVVVVHVGDIQADFDDVRFTNQFGEILAEKKCSFVSAVNATFVVKVEADMDVDQLVYVYFGCLSAVDASSDNALVDVISGAVGAWNMQEANAGDAVEDYSGNGNDGTATDTTIIDSKFVGKKARSFDGLNDKIAVTANNAFNFGAGNFSISTYVKLDSDAQFLLSSHGDWINGYQFAVYGQRAYISLGDGATVKYEWDPIAVSLIESWHLVTVTVNRATNQAILYIDAAPEVTKDISATAGSIAVNSDLWFGAFGGWAFFLDGSLSGQYLFGDVLSAGQITNMSANYPDSTLEAGKVLVRKWASTTLPVVTDISDVVNNSAVVVSPSPLPVSNDVLSNSMLFVLGFMSLFCVVGLVWLSRSPVVPLVIGLFTFLVGLYAAFGGIYSLGVVQGWFSLFVALFGGLTMLLVGLGVRVRK